MNVQLIVKRAGPAMTLQDLGRPNRLAQGLSQGGAADRLALLEAAALLGTQTVLPAIEMAGFGGEFQTTAPLRFALTGGAMATQIDDTPLMWNRTYTLYPKQTLKLGSVVRGSYGYLTPAAPLATPAWQDSQSAHLLAGIGAMLQSGTRLDLGTDPNLSQPDRKISPSDRFSGGFIRIIPGPQTCLFSSQTVERFLNTRFQRSPQANRQGVRLDGADPFAAQIPAGLASEFITTGDIQMTGQGVPYVLLAECQTIGGYPRIATVIPADIPKMAQAPVGSMIEFDLIPLEQADHDCIDDAKMLQSLRAKVAPCIRDPHDIPNLLGYQLISGMIAGTEFDEDTNDAIN
jgi:allophanate hydrolase